MGLGLSFVQWYGVSIRQARGRLVSRETPKEKIP